MEEEEEKKGIAWHGSSADSMRIAITPIVTFPITYKSCRTEAIEQKKVRDGRRKWPYITPEMEVGGAVCGHFQNARQSFVIPSFFFCFIRSRKEFSLARDQMKIVSTPYEYGSKRCLTSEEKPSACIFSKIN